MSNLEAMASGSLSAALEIRLGPPPGRPQRVGRGGPLGQAWGPFRGPSRRGPDLGPPLKEFYKGDARGKA